MGEDKGAEGLTENDGHENDGPSKLQGMKLQDMKIQDMKMQDTMSFSNEDTYILTGYVFSVLTTNNANNSASKQSVRRVEQSKLKTALVCVANVPP